MPLFSEWVNVGGQIIPRKRLDQLFDYIKEESINSWEEIHAYYRECQEQYDDYKVAYALNLLEKLYTRPISEFNKEIYEDIAADSKIANVKTFDETLISRMKDFDDEFRMQTFNNAREMNAVLGSITDNEFIMDMRENVQNFEKCVSTIFDNLKT